jgi:HSP20 family protein
MTTTPDTSCGNERQARSCGPRGCGPRGFGNRFDGAFGGPYGPHFAAKFGGPDGGWRQAPVNIEETAEAYILSLYAPGLAKSGIRVSVQDDVLSVRYVAAQTDDSKRKFTRRELPNNGFEREFALNTKVQTDSIVASYSEGVLIVRLPKTPDAMQPEHHVPVQ